MSIRTAPLCARMLLCLHAIVLCHASAVALADVSAKPAEPAAAVAPAAAAQPAAVQPAAAVQSAQPAVAPAEAPAEVTVAGLGWHTDYNAAYRDAKAAKRMLLINFVREAGNDSTQQNAENSIAGSRALQAKLTKVVLARLPLDAQITVNGKPQRLIGSEAFSHLQGGPGFVLIDLVNAGQPYYGCPVNVLPYSSGKYYRWRPDYLSVILDLPPGTLTQRTMVWAVRIHPENPQSTYGEANPGLANGATQQASYQANVGQQGHQNFENRYGHLSAASGGGQVSEVCAESWPGQNMIDSCIDCVDSWRHSSGHWRGVAGRHHAFGYDIRRGRNGIWYGTGIFAN